MPKIRAVLVTPLTGPLSLYGKTSAAGLEVWAKNVAQLPSPWSGIDLDVQDTGADVEAAIQRVLATQPDVLFGPYGRGPMFQAARVARTHRRLLWNHGGASARFVAPAFPQVINILSPASTYFAQMLHAIHHTDPTVKTVSVFHSTTGFGREVAAGAIATATQLQMTVEVVAFEPSQAGSMVSMVPESDVLLVVSNFADELSVAPELLDRRFRFRAFVGAGVEEVLAPLGERREGLLGPAQWLPEAPIVPDEGPDAAWFVDAYRTREGTEPPYAAAQAFAAGLVFARCLRECGDLDEGAIQATAQHLTCRTLYGPFQLDPASGLQVGHQVLIVQWQEGMRRIVWPSEYAERTVLL